MDYSNQIKTLEREISINQSIIDQEYWHIGNALRENTDLGASIPSAGKQGFDKITADCDELSESKTKLSDEIQVLQQLIDQVEDLQSSIEKRQTDFKQKEGEIRELYKSIGSKAFDLYASAPQTYSVYDLGFQAMDEQYREKYKLESKIDDLNNSIEKDPLLKKLVNQTRLQMQKGSLKSLGNKIDEGFEKIARALAETDVSENNNLTDILKPLDKLQHKQDEIKKIITKHEEDLQGVELKLREHCGKQKPGDYIEDINLRISELDEELREKLTASGKIVHDSIKSKGPEKLQPYLDNLSELHNENKNKNTLLVRLHAAQKVNALEEEKARFELKRSKLNNQIQEVQKQLDSVSGTISQLESEISAQGKIRGSEEDL